MEHTKKETTVVSELPRDDGWAPGSHVYKYNGSWYSEPFLNAILRWENDVVRRLSLSSSHTILCSIPKSGATWLKAQAFAISTRTRFDLYSENHPLLTSNPHQLVPFLETLNPIDHPNHPTLLATHMPYSALSSTGFSSDSKIVYMCRNPKDTLVSGWHFFRKVVYANNNQLQQEPVTMEKVFDSFCKGVFDFGPWWDHVLGYWKQSMSTRGPGQPRGVLFFKYEEVQRDGVSSLRRLAEFMCFPFTEHEEEGRVPQKIVKMCSFMSLSQYEVNKTGSLPKTLVPGGEATFSFPYSALFRKGETDDWKNYLT